MKKIAAIISVILIISSISFAQDSESINLSEENTSSIVPNDLVKLVSFNSILMEALHTKIENDINEEALIEKNIKDIDTYKTFKINVNKDEKILRFYGDDKLVGKYKAAMGRSQKEGTKEVEGDYMTPEGTFYICEKHHSKNYKLFMGLSYPGIEDAKRGFEKGFITEKEYNQIVTANENKKTPLWNTKLGGTVGIHGGGKDVPYTRGCVMLDNDVIEFLWKYTPQGAEVVIE
ncbi:MAG: L,D-transpeptidase [Firmicutes bacterium]|jgi:murein L,D-transpeptidase YafK|nr:L,D-transpeptidase [Bacillota bacterium]